MGFLTFASLKREDSMFGTNPSVKEIRGCLLSFIPFFLVYSKLRSQTSQGETLQPMALFVHCPRLIERSSTSLWLKHVISTAFLLCWRTLENGPYQVIMQRYMMSYRNRPLEVTRANAFQVGFPNIPSSASILKQISDDQQNPEDPCAALNEFKVVLEKT